MFHILDKDWPRREYFRHYLDNMRCTYSLTVQIDITGLRRALRAGGYKEYPAQIYLLAAAVNRFPAFRMGISESGEPGYWETLHPSYTVMAAGRETFSSLWTPYEPDFSRFYSACVRHMERYAHVGGLEPQGETPPNAFNISSVPWIDFTAFNLNVYTAGTHLLPIFTIGRYVEQDGRTLMPLALQLHHAACDGLHAGRFIQALREMAAAHQSWLSPREPPRQTHD